MVRHPARWEAASSIIPGHVPWCRAGPEPCGVYGSAARRRVFRFIRRLHDLTAGTPVAGGYEVLCHGDLAYFNTVYPPTKAGTYLPVAFIDWDLARPGTRLEDVSHAIWQFLSLGDPGTDQWVDEHPRLIVECCDIFGLADRAGLIDAVIFEQRRTVDGMREALAAGHLSPRLSETGAMAKVQRMLDWTVGHRDLYASPAVGRLGIDAARSRAVHEASTRRSSGGLGRRRFISQPVYPGRSDRPPVLNHEMGGNRGLLEPDAPRLFAPGPYIRRHRQEVAPVVRA
jgi:hypothetical protein